MSYFFITFIKFTFVEESNPLLPDLPFTYWQWTVCWNEKKTRWKIQEYSGKVCVCLCACMHACLCLCVHAYVCMHGCVHVCYQVWMQIWIQMCINSQRRELYIFFNVCVYFSFWLHTSYSSACLHACIHMNARRHLTVVKLVYVNPFPLYPGNQ